MKKLLSLGALFALPFLSAQAFGAPATGCKGLPTHAQLTDALKKVVVDGNGGFFKPNAMWLSLVDRSGTVCAVTKVGDAWPGSRTISAQKAFAANAFSNEFLSLSTANLYSAVQAGGSLFGLQSSNLLNAAVAYKGSAEKFGTAKDPLVGERVGGLIVFGGGLALYDETGKKVLGALGVSGDSSCTDHVIAWKVRQELNFTKLPGGKGAAGDDNIVFDIADATGKSAGGFGHPVCGPKVKEISEGLKLTK